MSSARAFRLASRLGSATTLLMFGLMILGSIVRTTGSGLACPDWPLCHGKLIPPFQFNVLIEWFHRLVALLVSLCVLGLAVLTVAHRDLRSRLGGLLALVGGLLAVQILLGALTVWKLLDPGVVGGHLAVALVLFSSMLIYTLVAEREAEADEAPNVAAETVERPRGLVPLFAITAFATWGQAVLGGMVSSHGAALACPEWPTCNGAWFPPLEGLVGLQMLHRYGAYALVALIALTAWRAASVGDPGLRDGSRMALLLTGAQIALGICNVFLRAPVWLSAAHLATATAILGLLVALTLRAAALPAEARTFDPVPAR